MSKSPGHPGFGRWKHIDVPIDVADRLQIPREVPEGWQRPRQCLIDDVDTISFARCLGILGTKWNATESEIALWISLGPTGAGPDDDEHLHVFDSRYEIWDDNKLLRWRIKRMFPGIEGGSRLCTGFPVDDAPPGGSITEILGWHTFSRTEVERFDPSKNRHDDGDEIKYYVNAGSVASGGWFNPSGRFLSYEEAVGFLSRYVPGEQMARDAIKQEFSYREVAPGFGCRPLNAFKPPFGIWLNHDEEPQLEDGFFFEGQIVGLAKEKFGADIRSWDAATYRWDSLGFETIAGRDIASDIMHWPECRQILRDRWDASPAEIAMWVRKDVLCAFEKKVLVRTDKEYWVWKRGLERFSSSPDEANPDDLLSEFGYCRAQVECFNPETYPIVRENITYRRGEFGGSYNPSGRFLSYYQALAFLTNCPNGNLPVARAMLQTESRKDQNGLWPHHFVAYRVNSDADLRHPVNGKRALRLMDALFVEAQILGLAKERFGCDVRHWDDASRPRWQNQSPNPPRVTGPGVSLRTLADAGQLPDRLTVEEIATLHPSGDAFANQLIEAYLSRSLSAECNAKLIEQECVRLADRSQLIFPDLEVLTLKRSLLVQGAELQRYLEHYGMWPLPERTELAGWWLGLKGVSGQDDGKALNANGPAVFETEEIPPTDGANTRKKSRRRGSTRVIDEAYFALREKLRREPEVSDIFKYLCEAAAPTHEHISGGRYAANLRITSPPSCRKRNRRLSRRAKERPMGSLPDAGQ